MLAISSTLGINFLLLTILATIVLLASKISKVIGALLSLGLSVVLAVFDYGVFALVYSVIFQALFSNVCYFIIGIRTWKVEKANNISLHYYLSVMTVTFFNYLNKFH